MTSSLSPDGFDDVRMRGFRSRTTVSAALAWVDQCAAVLPATPVPLRECYGRVLAEDLVSGVSVPAFQRAMMDGFAVRASDTFGATPYNPLTLSVVDEVLPGRAPRRILKGGEAIRIMTGAPVPGGADAVIPAEKVTDRGEQVQILDEVPPGKHIGGIGEDVEKGDAVLSRGRVLRPQDLGVLSSLGCSQVHVVRRPKVRLIITGDELCPAGTMPSEHQTVDANSPMLQALIERDGGEVLFDGILADTPEVIGEAMLAADADVVIVSGGSSVGQEDHAPRLLASHGELTVHGIAMRPSSPTGMGRISGRCVFLLPGNPVSCLCAYDFFAGRGIRRLAGLPTDWPYRSIRAILKRKISSVVGRQDYARVKVDGQGVEPIAIGGASVLSSTTRADGFVVIEADSEGDGVGAEVEVYLYG